MTNNLAQIIFDQFYEILEKKSHNYCCDFTVCDFEYRQHQFPNHSVLDVIYIDKDECQRRRDVGVTIDITGICLEDLTRPKWVRYLKKQAHEFLEDICPKRIVIVKEKNETCRKETPCWSPFPCKTITTVVERIKPIEKVHKPKIVIKQECACVPECRREKCEPKRVIVVKKHQEPTTKCGNNLVLVKSNEPKHDWGFYKGNRDYNNHKWKGCCGSSNQEVAAHQH